MPFCPPHQTRLVHTIYPEPPLRTIGTMRRTLAFSSLLVLSCLQTYAQPAAPEQPILGAIPATHGNVLTGQSVDLPKALQGHTAVLVLGFSEASRPQVTAWGRLLAADYRQSPTVLYYEMPVLAAVPRFLRGFVLKKVKEGVPERAQPHCLPVVDHEKEWKSLAAFHNPDDAYILLVDSTGQVHDHWAGDATPTAYATVKQHLAALPPG